MICHKESILVEKIVIYLPHMYLHRKKKQTQTIKWKLKRHFTVIFYPMVIPCHFMYYIVIQSL